MHVTKKAFSHGATHVDTRKCNRLTVLFPGVAGRPRNEKDLLFGTVDKSRPAVFPSRLPPQFLSVPEEFFRTCQKGLYKQAMFIRGLLSIPLVLSPVLLRLATRIFKYIRPPISKT